MIIVIFFGFNGLAGGGESVDSKDFFGFLPLFRGVPVNTVPVIVLVVVMVVDMGVGAGVDVVVVVDMGVDIGC